jgi:hypothetical protein
MNNDFLTPAYVWMRTNHITKQGYVAPFFANEDHMNLWIKDMELLIETQYIQTQPNSEFVEKNLSIIDWSKNES